MDTAQASAHSLASDEATVGTGEKDDAARAGERARVEISEEWTRALVELGGATYERGVSNEILPRTRVRGTPDRELLTTFYEPPYTEPYVRWCERTGASAPSYSILFSYSPYQE